MARQGAVHALYHREEAALVHHAHRLGDRPRAAQGLVGDVDAAEVLGRVLYMSHADEVVGASRLRAGAHARTLPSAEGLTADDRARDRAVDVDVARLDPLQPDADLLPVQGVQTGGQAVVDGVLPVDRLVQRLGAHDAEDGAEVLRQVVFGQRLDAGAHARGPQPLPQSARLDRPGLAFAELGQPPEKLAVRRFDHRAHLRGQVLRVADLERSHGVDELTLEALGESERADEDDERGGRALLPRVPERRVHDVLDGQVDVRVRRDDDGVLPGRLGEQAQVGPPRAEHPRGLRRAGEDDLVGSFDDDPPQGGRVHAHQAEHIAGHPGLPHEVRQVGAGAPRELGGLEDHARPRGEGREDAARRDGDREVPRRGDEGRGHGPVDRAAQLVEPFRQFRVVEREVDGLGDLDVALVERLAGLAAGDLHEFGAVVLQRLGDGPEDRGPLPARTGRPRGRGGGHGIDEVPRLLLRGDHVRLDEVDPQCGGGDAGGDPLGPDDVGVERVVGVRHVGEAFGDPRSGAAVLCATRPHGQGADQPDGPSEARLLQGEDGLLAQVEDVGHEVLGRGVLLEPAHEVGDRDVVLLGADDRDVVQDRADGVPDGARLRSRHARQHLDVHALGDAPVPGRLQAVGESEEVHAGYADVDGVDAFGRERGVEHGQIVGVGLGLAGLHRELPAVDDRVHPFHGEVRALDHAHLDRRPSPGPPGLRPLGQVVEAAERVGKVGLEDDPGAVAQEFLHVEDPLEDVDRQVEVAVLLHVEVDEGPLGLREPVDGQEFGDGVLDGRGVPEGRVRADHRGDLERDVVDVVAGDELLGRLHAPGGLCVAEHGLAQEVEVETRSVGAELGDGRAEAVGRHVEDEVADEGREDPLGGRRGEPGGHGRDSPPDLRRQAQIPGEERGVAFGQAFEVVRRDGRVFGADHAVHERHRVIEAPRMVQHLGQQLRRGCRGIGSGRLAPFFGLGYGALYTGFIQLHH